MENSRKTNTIKAFSVARNPQDKARSNAVSGVATFAGFYRHAELTSILAKVSIAVCQATLPQPYARRWCWGSLEEWCL